MKQLTAIQNSNRRSNSFGRGSAAIDGGDGAIRSPAAVFWLVLHGLCCLISLILGFRFSRVVFFLLFASNSRSPSAISTTSMFEIPMPFLKTRSDVVTGTVGGDPIGVQTPANGTVAVGGSRVVVGRHGIRIRPWPHPDPEEVIKAHRILERVQREQRVQYGVKNPRSVIVVTPTYVRTFQALHLTGVMHSLMNVGYDVVWIVVEAGGVTNETASLLAKSGIRSIHVGFDQKMPIIWADRYKVEDKMRLQALRVVREQRLDGIVTFADDSNMHSLEFFDEAQKVNWIGALSVGILVHSGDFDEPLHTEKLEDERSSLPVQGPACNSSDNLVGWHTFDAMSYAEKSATFIGDVGVVLPIKLEWAGFVLNSRLLWRDAEEKPDWVKDLDSLGEEDVNSPLSLIKDPSVVEALGNCGRKVLLWWLRVEARADSKFPTGWTINTPLEITVPAKRTPWPDTLPELASNTRAMITTTTTEQHFIEQLPEKRSPKSRSSRKRGSRSKRKREGAIVMQDTHVSSSRHGEK